jgi:hypothetical protein
MPPPTTSNRPGISDGDNASSAHRYRQHNSTGAEIAGCAIDDDGVAAAQIATLQAAERHDQFGEADQLRRRFVR